MIELYTVLILLQMTKGNTLNPHTLTANVGATVKITCSSISIVNWKFQRKNEIIGALPPNGNTSYLPGSDVNVLKIKNVRLANAGTYICAGHDKHGNYFEERGLLAVGE